MEAWVEDGAAPPLDEQKGPPLFAELGSESLLLIPWWQCLAKSFSLVSSIGDVAESVEEPAPRP